MSTKNYTTKPLIYTIATNDTASFNCALLLYKSLNKFLRPGGQDFDFKVIVPEDSQYYCSDDLKDFLFPIYNYYYKNTHIFTLKYHYSIFNLLYDNFIYMDSDILWMIPELYDLEYNCICTESMRMTHSCFSKFWPKDIDKRLIGYFRGINAGFFGLKKSKALELSKYMMRNLYGIRKFNKKRLYIEQNLFNVFIYNEYIQNNIDQWKDVSHKFILGANAESPYINNISYHFYGNMCNMSDKFDRMNLFLKNNNITL